MENLKDKILQYIISGKYADDKAIDGEILNDPSFDQDEYDLLTNIWELSDNLKDFKTASKSDAWQNILQETGLDEAKQVSLWQRWSIAASVLILIGAGIYLFPRNPYITSDVAVTEQELVLPDDTKVTLQPGSTVRYLKPRKFEQENQRIVYLDGEGIFEVTHDPNRPFKVVTEFTSVDVTGTIFMFREEGILSETENLDGLIDFGTNDGSQKVSLKKGDKASYDGGEIEVIPFEPPPPPPPPPPVNKISAFNLVEILGDLYPERLELSPGLRPNQVVIEVDLKLPLGELLESLRENANVTIDFAPRGRNNFKLSTLRGTDTGLQADITFDSYIDGQSFK